MFVILYLCISLCTLQFVHLAEGGAKSGGCTLQGVDCLRCGKCGRCCRCRERCPVKQEPARCCWVEI